MACLTESKSITIEKKKIKYHVSKITMFVNILYIYIFLGVCYVCNHKAIITYTLYIDIHQNATNPSQAFTRLMWTFCVLKHLTYIKAYPMASIVLNFVVNTVTHSEAFALAEHCATAKALWCVKHHTAVVVYLRVSTVRLCLNVMPLSHWNGSKVKTGDRKAPCSEWRVFTRKQALLKTGQSYTGLYRKPRMCSQGCLSSSDWIVIALCHTFKQYN